MVSGAFIAHLTSVLVTTTVVLVTDYLHLLGLRSPALEHGLIRAYPKVANTIGVLIGFVGLTTLLMLGSEPTLLNDPMFIVSLTILAVAVFNGFFLHHKFFPEFFEELDADRLRARTIPRTVLSASVSMASWAFVLFLSTPLAELGSPTGAVIAYVMTIGACYAIALPLERRALKKKRIAHERITIA